MSADHSLIAMSDLDADSVTRILDDAQGFSELGTRTIKKVPTLRGRTIVNLFYENSTRTRVSFETAAHRMSADVLSLEATRSSVAKGESLRDTAQTLVAEGADAVVIRHPSPGAPARLTGMVDVPVINAGDGAHQHPTQALLDLFTIRSHFGSIEGLRVAIVGDIAHSRVARSLIDGLQMFGVAPVLVAPPTMLPRPDSQGRVLGCDAVHHIDDALESVDVVYLLRVQFERHSEMLVGSQGEYRSRFALTADRAARLPESAIIMHPGPLNRGVEVDFAVADAPNSLILQQVTAGISVRMAVLWRALGGAA